jgi:hypothetical protein
MAAKGWNRFGDRLSSDSKELRVVTEPFSGPCDLDSNFWNFYDVMLTRRLEPLVDAVQGLTPSVDGTSPSHRREKIASFTRVRDGSRLGARRGHAVALTVDKIERNTSCRVRSERQLGRKSSKRVQRGEPIQVPYFQRNSYTTRGLPDLRAPRNFIANYSSLLKFPLL